MAKRSVYFSDELEAELDQHPEIVLATICQDAVRAAISSSRDEDPVTEARRLIRQADRLLTGEVSRKAARKRNRVKT